MAHDAGGDPLADIMLKVYENTFRVEPEPNEKFNVARVEALLKDVITNKLARKEYNAQTCPLYAREICAEVQDKAKAFGYKRYKLVTQVTIGEVQGQGIHLFSHCLWDAEKDNYASFNWSNGQMHCSAVVFGLYYE
eukprot:gnl/Hemi2/18842_TR6244_c0_g1_i1.p1 gnl/Hemi2/18842_TR6244_c0_g1~~gnl/Hemi2/18842_TR6244_c0_g1_i1.p1  ORF type:complete len:150 (+),score=24.46 gnl/Hemi2/18842_TR6244_c0_g1_i1:44-451(+)